MLSLFFPTVCCGKNRQLLNNNEKEREKEMLKSYFFFQRKKKRYGFSQFWYALRRSTGLQKMNFKQRCAPSLCKFKGSGFGFMHYCFNMPGKEIGYSETHRLHAWFGYSRYPVFAFFLSSTCTPFGSLPFYL